MSANTSSLMTFNADLEAFAKKIDLAPKVVVQRITADLHNRITQRTPVDTGRARASWDVKEGAPSEYLPAPGEKNGPDPSATIASIDGKQPVFITTALDYVQYLEAGSSQQAPAGMVALSLAEVEAEIEAIIGDPL